MKQTEDHVNHELIALKVEQWLNAWDKVSFDLKQHRDKPEPFFYLFTLPAPQLRALCGIYRRTTTGGIPRAKDLGIQRRHDEERSEEIRKFIQHGYPWSELSEAKRESGQFDDLRKPGWLPTAIVVNILKTNDKRHGQTVAPEDLIKVRTTDASTASIELPHSFDGASWRPKQLPPIEVIDGQHRLWAFDEQELPGKFSLPVVAFYGLDISWQAYLFWTINIKPKRINASLAFDLYPLLRTEDWLERFEGHAIYRETRAQELVSALWAHPDSPWYQRINMLGETGQKQPMVSQAAWIRSLMATYIKPWEGKRVQIGGLFGTPIGSDEEVLPWGGAQQAAFLILVGDKIRNAIKNNNDAWANALRKSEHSGNIEGDPALTSSYSLLNTDQGIRAILYITNDMCYTRAAELKLSEWSESGNAAASDEQEITKAFKSLQKQPVAKYLANIATHLAKYDWRTSSEPSLKEGERMLKAAFRGSGGYKELRLQLLRHLIGARGEVGSSAKIILDELGYKDHG